MPSLVGQTWAAPRHRVSIAVRGAFATVTVERPLAFQIEEARSSDEVVVDLDLPAGARWVGAEVQGPGFTRRLQVALPPEAGDTYAERLRTRGLRPHRGRLDEASDYRLRVAHPAFGRGSAIASTVLKLRYLAPLACSDGRFVLRMPGPLDPDPTPAEVVARVQPGPGKVVAEASLAAVPWPAGKPAPRATLHARSPARAAWELSFRSEEVAAADPSAALQVLATTMPRPKGNALPSPRSALALCAAAARPTARPPAPPPAQVIVLMDRSRSVGAAGISLERDAIRALLEALPPSLSFNVVIFDRTARILFPTSRTATREALQAIDEAATPGALANGTELVEALRTARSLGERYGGSDGPTWWILVTDGALPDHLSPAQIRDALPKAGRLDRAGVLVVRAGADERPTKAALRLLAELPLALGGVLRELREPDVVAGAGVAVRDLLSSGDLFDPRVAGPGVDRALDVALAPGAGRFVFVEEPLRPGLEVRARFGGRPAASSLVATDLPRDWAPLDHRAGTPVLVARGPDLVASLEPGGEAHEQDVVTRGQLDRGVLRNALSLAFLPRARACYVTRPVRNAEDKELAGRLRLELSLERGEVTDARVTHSTLARPDIEACLRDAALAVEVPRPMYRDAPVAASLNLVFRPRTPSAAKPPAVDEDIDLILGPLPASDPMRLLEGGPLPPGPGADPVAPPVAR